MWAEAVESAMPHLIVYMLYSLGGYTAMEFEFETEPEFTKACCVNTLPIRYAQTRYQLCFLIRGIFQKVVVVGSAWVLRAILNCAESNQLNYESSLT